MAGSVGFTNAEWQNFKKNILPVSEFLGGIKSVVQNLSLRYKHHALAWCNCSLTVSVPPNVPPNGGYDYVDVTYLEAVEAEFPLDPLFATDFRSYMTRTLHVDDDRDIISERNGILWTCCLRMLHQGMSVKAQDQYIRPLQPFSLVLHKYGFSGKTGRNNVTIEEIPLPPGKDDNPYPSKETLVVFGDAQKTVDREAGDS